MIYYKYENKNLQAGYILIDYKSYSNWYVSRADHSDIIHDNVNTEYCVKLHTVPKQILSYPIGVKYYKTNNNKK